MDYISINPATGERIASYPAWDDARLERTLQSVDTARRHWHTQPVEERTRLLRQTARLLERETSDLAFVITHEMGKPIREARAEIEKCARVCDYYADHAAAMLADELVETDAEASYVSYLPLGTILAVMPWNFPFWQVFRFAAPTLAAGNIALLKHARSVPRCALAIEDLLRRAGFPGHVFTTLLIDNDQAARLIADPRIHAVTLTGSERAGAAVAGQAGRHVKKTVLELGGSDPFIVLDDADVEQSAAIGVASRYVNGGQSCIAAKRFIVARPVVDHFVSAFRERAARLVQGDPMDDQTDIGPMARADLREHLHEQVQRSIAAGARPLLGCKPRSGAGFFYTVSMLGDVGEAMPAACQELFGPVAAIMTAADEAEAIRLANASPYGLASTICSRDPARARAMARQLETGSTFINSMVRSDPRLPFGGVKLSGYGRELAWQGIREFCNIKTIVQH